jgi:asparagine synthase (glutamine-hydrolysing)
MGAIYGIFGESTLSEIDRMGERLVHRGAVGGAWSVSPKVNFGQRVEGPPDEAFTPPENPITFDGFIDNSVEIGSLIGRKTSVYSSDSDLIFELYQKRGPEGFCHISGQFALGIWDESKQSLILACDSWSTKSLYLTQAEGRYFFASEYKALLAIDSVSARPNREAIQYLQCTKYVIPGACCLADVHSLVSGTWIELSSSGISVYRYQNLKVDIPKRSDQEHVEAVRKNLIEAVRRQTQDFETIGVSLSGGLDSAVIVGAVKDVSPEKPLYTFTAGFGAGDRALEEAAEVVSHFRTLHHEVLLSIYDIPTLLPPTLWHMEEPIGGEEKIFYYITASEAAKHVPILLAGHNADALFGGMPRHLIVKLASIFPFLKNPLAEFYHYTQIGDLPRSILGKLLLVAYYKGRNILPPRVLDTNSMLQDSVFLRKSPQPLNELLKDAQLSGPNANSTIEKIHAACGVIFKSPFLDTDLVRSSFQIPDRLKILRLRQKYILRKAYVGLLPDNILNRKKGFLRLEHDKKFCDFLDGLAEDLLSPQAVTSRGLFEQDYVSRIRIRPRGGVYTTEQIYRLWSLLLVEVWCRLFIDGRGKYDSIFQKKVAK